MSGQTVGSMTLGLDSILKRLYIDKPHDTLNSKHKFFKRLPKEYNKDGSEYQDVHRVGGSGSMGFMGESNSLQSAGKQTWANGTIKPFGFWATAELSQQFLSQAKTQQGSWLQRYKAEVDGFIKDEMVRMEITAFGKGDGACGVVTNLGTTTFDLVTWQDARKLRKGSRIAFWAAQAYSSDAQRFNAATDPANGLAYATVVGVSLSGTTATVTVDQDLSAGTGWGVAGSQVVNGDFVHFHLARTASASNTMPGLQLLVNGNVPEPGKTVLQGLSTAENYWQSTVMSNGGTNRPITDTLLQQMQDAGEISGGDPIDFYTCNLGARLDYAVGEMNKRRNVNTNEVSGKTAGGFNEPQGSEMSVEFNGVDFYPNRFHETNVINGIKLSDLCLYYWAKLQWWEDGSGIWRRSYNGSTSMMAEQFAYLNFVVKNRHWHVRAEDVDESEVQRI